MSSLNAAFIKAYGLESEATEPAEVPSPPHNAPPAPHTALGVPMVLATGPTSFETIAPPPETEHGSAKHSYTDEAVAAKVVPAPHADFFGDGVRVTSAEPALAKTPQASPAGGRPTADKEARGPLCPAYRVDHLTWPPLCDQLLGTNDSQCGQVADELTSAGKNGRKVWLITSVRHGEGRTTMALLLARILGGRGSRVALVDADFQNPQLARRLGLLLQLGWEGVLSGGLALDEPLIDSPSEHVSLLPLVETTIEPAKIVTNPSWRSALTRLSGDFDVVIVDSGPLSAGSVASSLAAKHGAMCGVDAVLLVRDVRVTHAETVNELGCRFRDAGVRHGAIADNFVDAA